MLKLLRAQLHQFDRWFGRLVLSWDWSAIVKDSKRFMRALGDLPLVIVGSKNPTWALGIFAFTRFSTDLYKKQGMKGLFLYLKTSQVLLMSALAMPSRKLYKEKLGTRVATTRNGFPRIIPVPHRRLIQQGNGPCIRLWLTLFSLYRVLEVAGDMKLKTIYAPGKRQEDIVNHRILDYRKAFFSHLSLLGNNPDLLLGPEWTFKPSGIIAKSTPNTTRDEISFLAVLRDAYAWVHHPLWSALVLFVSVIDGNNRDPNPNVPDGAPHRKRPIRTDGSLGEAISLMRIIGRDLELHSTGGRLVRAIRLDRLRKYILSANIVGQPASAGGGYLWKQMWDLIKSLTKAPYIDLGNCRSYKEWVIRKYRYGSIATPSNRGILGKLGIKDEPGKVRVFACVDIWTQWILKPLHDYIFDILKSIPQDGTFNHKAAVTSFRDHCKEREITDLYSYDLSSATDRLPIGIQVRVLGELIGTGLACLWALLLIGRGYRQPGRVGKRILTKAGYHRIPPFLESEFFKSTIGCYAQQVDLKELFHPLELRKNFLYYGAGQPMGCLSSWAVFALTHHFLVQSAYWECGGVGWFEDYALLGDDLVVGNARVASKYLQLCGELGIPINQSKSLISDNGSFELAKQFVYKGRILSPFSFREMIAAKTSLMGVVALFNKSEVDHLRMSSVLRFLKLGVKACHLAGSSFESLMAKKKFKLLHLLAFLTSPGVSQWSAPDYRAWVAQKKVGLYSPSGDWATAQNEFVEELEILKDRLEQDKEVLSVEKAFPTSQYHQSLYLQVVGSLIESWRERYATLSEDVKEFISFASVQDELGEVLEWYIETQKSLVEVPMNIRWETRMDNPKVNIRGWLQLWVRLTTAYHKYPWKITKS
jgi:hypothetical protein